MSNTCRYHVFEQAPRSSGYWHADPSGLRLSQELRPRQYSMCPTAWEMEILEEQHKERGCN